jgi:hypothetical protein
MSIRYHHGDVRFDLLPLRLDFTAHDTLHFPPGKAANLLRGAFGMALDPALFSPKLAEGPSGLADPPRPFVFRCRHLDGVTVRAGADFHFHLNLFAMDDRDLVARAFAEAARQGFGPGRGRAEMRECSGEPISIPLLAPSAAVKRVRVDFLTPTEVKHDGRLLDVPEFAVLFARIRDRVSALRGLYGPGPLEIDFAALGERAHAVELAGSKLRWVSVERRSSRTGQTHPIGGFQGTVEYTGPLGEFLPYLEAARWTGVGRQAVWGKGEIAVSIA